MKSKWAVSLIATLMSMSVNAEKSASDEYCDSLKEFAAAAFQARQTGQSKQLILGIAKDSADMTDIVELAYKVPLLTDLEKSVEGSIERSKSIFSENIRIDCKRHALQRLKEGGLSN